MKAFRPLVTAERGRFARAGERPSTFIAASVALICAPPDRVFPTAGSAVFARQNMDTNHGQASNMPFYQALQGLRADRQSAPRPSGSNYRSRIGRFQVAITGGGGLPFSSNPRGITAQQPPGRGTELFCASSISIMPRSNSFPGMAVANSATDRPACFFGDCPARLVC
jgi:hypothetical protein